MEKVHNNGPFSTLVTFNDGAKAGVASSVFWSAVSDCLPSYLSGEPDNPFVFSKDKEVPYQIGIHLFPEFKERDYACRIVFTERTDDMTDIVEIKHFKEYHVPGVDDFNHDVLKQTRFVFQKAKEILQILSDRKMFFEKEYPGAMSIVMSEKNEPASVMLAE